MFNIVSEMFIFKALKLHPFKNLDITLIGFNADK